MKELERIREIVSAYGYEETGMMIGVSGRTVRRWCEGDYNPSILAVEAIKRMLAKRDKVQTT
jgi:DNA-binding XRE family transcriptional regulator